MTQPPPNEGGYPPPPDPQGGYGQQPPPGGVPGGPPPGGGPPPPPGQPPGSPPSGFPPPGPPPPKKGGAGKILAIVGGAVALVLIVCVGLGFVVLSNSDQGGDNGSSGAENAEEGGDTEAAQVGDCTNETAETNEYTDTDASDVVTVSCDSSDAYFEIVEREDSPSTSDEEQVADEVCTGTMATDYIYQHRGSDLEWLICLDPIDIETAEWGAIPGEVGQCWSDNENYYEIVPCDDSSARFELTYAEENPDTSAATAAEAAEELCPQDATAYWSDPQEPPFDWYICGVDV